VLKPQQELDFSRPMMPDALARTRAAPGLAGPEALALNHIRAHEYLSIFGLVEEFILPFVLDHVREELAEDDWRTRALLQFASEEAKHIQLFRRFHAAFVRGFGVPCAMIGPPQEVATHVLSHDRLAVALLILHIEWMTQAHYLSSVRNEPDLDPLMESLLRHHWMEEAGHARLDTLMVEALAEGRSPESRLAAVETYMALGGFLDEGLKAQTRFNLDALEAKTGRKLAPEARAALEAQQHQSARHTYIGSGMTHPKFRATLGAVSPEGLARVDALAPAFA
jgi:hypothetical protein